MKASKCAELNGSEVAGGACVKKVVYGNRQPEAEVRQDDMGRLHLFGPHESLESRRLQNASMTMAYS